MVTLPKTPTRAASSARATGSSTAWQTREWLKCSFSPLYFVHTYCSVYDAIALEWIPFHLWPDQAHVLKTFQLNRLVVVLKARQVGMT